MRFSRNLRYDYPLSKGEDVLFAQRVLQKNGYTSVGQPDGIFGRKTDGAVRKFQSDQGLGVDGIIGPKTWAHLVPLAKRSPESSKTPPGEPSWEEILQPLQAWHRYRGKSDEWRLQKDGIAVNRQHPERTSGEPKTVRRIWKEFGLAILRWSENYQVPAELILATICTESSGNPSAKREESGYLSDEKTPSRVSIGLMQTLISTARVAVGRSDIDRPWLLDPDNSIQAGTAYIASQFKQTGFDPPKVACAYNAGRVVLNDSPTNRWKMRQFPIGTGEHADRFIKWFNDFYAVLSEQGAEGSGIPSVSFYPLL
jgi:peptidoglycan hydrolase-like protein with peptidoglycan-binding domain